MSANNRHAGPAARLQSRQWYAEQQQRGIQNKSARDCIYLSRAFEFTLLLLAVAVFTGILSILKKYNNQELPDWENLGITLNTLISIPATVLRVIIAFIAFIAFEPLAQVKRDWISASFCPLPQLQLFENASRGVYGSVRLLPLVVFRQPVALGAAVVAILSLGIGSFTQQSIQTYQQLQSVPTGRGSATITIAKIANDYQLMNLDPVLMRQGFRPSSALSTKTRIAIHDSLVNPSNGSNIGSLFTCSSGNCTFPKFATSPEGQEQDKISYASLGMCSRCVDVRDFVDGPKFTHDTYNNTITRYDLPVFRFSDDEVPMRLEFGNSLMSEDIYMAVRWIGNVTWTRRVASPDFIHAARWSVANFSVLATPQDPCDQCHGSFPYATDQPTDYVATACTLYLCLKYYTAIIVGSRLSEKVIRDIPFRPQKPGPLWWGPVVNDSSSGTQQMDFIWHAVQQPCYDRGSLYTFKRMSSGPGDIQFQTEDWANQSIDELAQYTNLTAPTACIFSISGVVMAAFQTDYSSSFNANCFRDEVTLLEYRHNNDEPPVAYADFLAGFFRGNTTSVDTIRENVESMAMRITGEMRQGDKGFFIGLKGSLAMKVSQVYLSLLGLLPVVTGLGQQSIVAFNKSDDAFQLVGGDAGSGQIRVSKDEYWGVIRAAGDLAVDFGRVTGTNFTLSNGKKKSSPAKYKFKPVDVKNNTYYRTLDEQHFSGPNYSEPNPGNTKIIVGTIGHSELIDKLIKDGSLDVSEIKGKWESFVSQLVKDPIKGTAEALVIAGSDPRGTIYGIYDISEQIGVSPWYWWADVPIRKRDEIFVLAKPKVQKSPSVKYRGIFLNDEQPGLSSWVGSRWDPTWNNKAPYNHEFYALVSELLLRLRANYLWPTVWGSMVYIDDPLNQPLLDAYEIVLGGSHTEPMMRAQNEFRTFYEGEWQYKTNNETIDEYFRYGVSRAKPYARNSLWTMAMRGTGDTAIEGNLGIDGIVEMLETLVDNQREILKEGLKVKNLTNVPSLWCLYKEVQSYQERGLVVPEDITLLWADDNWGNIRRLPLANETDRSGGAGVYYHFDYVGDPRNYKWINTIQLEKTTEQMTLAYHRNARRIWIVNVGDLKPKEIPISHFMDLAYDTEKWEKEGTTKWVEAWVEREFGSEHVEAITDIMTRYGMYAARRKFELLEPQVYSVINYHEAEAILEQWATLKEDTQAVYDKLDSEYQPAFFEMLLHPVLGGEIVNKIQIYGARNQLYAGQKRNSANDVIWKSVDLMYKDSNLTQRWNELLDGKWAHMLDQTHLGYDGYWQQPMRNTLPDLRFVQDVWPSLGGQYGVGVEGSNATIQGDSRWHSLSSNSLELPPLEPHGAQSRYFDVFHRGNKGCNWRAAPWEDFIKLSQYNGTVGGDNGTDSRVYITVDWDNAPQAPNTTEVMINITSDCRGFEKYAGEEPKLVVTVINREVPDSFEEGFVESDGHVSIEASHYQKIHEGDSDSPSLEYHTIKNYGRTLAGMGLYPLNTEKLKVGEGPALEYDMYLFSNNSAVNVTVFMSPGANYLGDRNPLQYGITLFPADKKQPDPKIVTPIGPNKGTNMPDGWGYAVGNAVWGLYGNYTTSSFNVPKEGAYKLRIWALLPNILIQKIVVDLGGVRQSYLGPPESFLLGRDEMGKYNGTSFVSTPGIVGGTFDKE
ncbi:hypothetical protein ACKAV7_015115 [Fusarium commune]